MASAVGLGMLAWLWTALGCTRAVAQEQVPRSAQAWSTEEGLPDASVHGILQARDGFIWVATEGGVARFDGNAFTVFRHENQPAFSSDDVSSLLQDRSGGLWFGTADGLVWTDGASFRRYTEQDGLLSNRILALEAAADGALLVLTDKGVACRSGNGFHLLRGNLRNVKAMSAAPGGGVLLIQADGGVLRYQKGSVTREGIATPQNESLLSVQSGPGSAVWSYTAHTVELTTPTFHRILRAAVEMPGARVSSLFVDHRGTAWIGTSHGLFTLTPQPGSVAQAVDALSAASILCTTEDREGNLWIGTENRGLHILRQRSFRRDAASAGDAVTAVVTASDGAVWFGTRESGLHRIRRGVSEEPVKEAALTSPVILSLALGTRGDLWAGTPDGLNHISGNVVRKYTSADGLPDDFVRSLLVDGYGTVWVGTRRGLARIANDRITTIRAGDHVGSDSIGPLLQGTEANKREDLWIGTAGGLSHLLNGQLENFVPLPGQAGPIMTALAMGGSGELLVGIHGAGLLLFKAGKFSPVSFKPQLPQEVSAIVPDATGHVWMRSPRGVYRATLESLHGCIGQTPGCTVPLEVFSTLDGLPSDAPAADGSPQIAQAADGLLWVATRRGLAVADPANLPGNNIAPLVAVERFTVDDRSQPITYSEVSVDPGHSRYTFSFAALSYTLPTKVHYRYRLDGFDRDWIDAGPSRTAYYTSLPPRRYQFRVQATGNDERWSETDAIVRFRIRPPFYRRWWFYALVVFLVMTMAFSLARLRERTVRRRFALILEERNRMAREIHDTLAQDFVSVSLQLEIASGLLKGKQVDAALQQLQGTRTLVREGLQAARQSIWNLRASAGEDSLPTRLAALVARYAVDGRPPRLAVRGAFRDLHRNVEDEVMRIAQESLRNVDRHAAATNADVELLYEHDELVLTVRDDGRGFSAGNAQDLEGHYGLRGLRERAAVLKADLAIISAPGQGTTIRLNVPLQGREASRP